jgi:hypothetical protein
VCNVRVCGIPCEMNVS